MQHFSFSSLRVRLALLIFLALLPVLVFTLTTDLEERALSISNVEDNVQQIAQYAAGTQEQLIEGTRKLLVALARLPEVRKHDADFCSSLFADMLKEYPRYTSLGAALPNGKLFCSAVHLRKAVSIAGQDWFQRVLKTREFAIGASHIGTGAGARTLNFAYPVLGMTGKVQAVVFAAMDLGQLNQIASEVQLPDQAEFVMLAQNGTILASVPNTHQWVGKTMSGTPMVQTILQEPAEDVTELPGLDGVLRLYAFTPLRSTVDTGLYIAVGIPTSIAYREADRILLEHLVSLLSITVAALLLVWFGSDWIIFRRVSALDQAAQRLSSGDMKARTGLAYGSGELDRLARTFDEMAQTLEERALKLRQAEARYRTLVEQIPIISYIANPDEARSTLYISPQMEKMCGYSASEWTPDARFWINHIHPDDIDSVKAALASLQCNPGEAQLHCEYRFLTRDGRWVWFNDEAVVVHDEISNTQYLQGIMMDTTDHREASEKLLAYQQQLRSLASELSLAEERERRRIATELHDRVGQGLAISKIKLGILKGAQASTELAEPIEEVRRLIEQAIQDTRSLIFEISSPILYELGFEAALEWLAEQVQKQHGIATRYVDDGRNKPLDHDIRIMLFQVANELLNNVVKHANAKSVKIATAREDRWIRLTIEDDGGGFDTSAIGLKWGRTDGFGLFSIRERLKYVNGCIEFNSQPGQGTQVILKAPLKSSADADTANKTGR